MPQLTDTEFLELADRFIAQNETAMWNDLATLVAVPSVEGSPQDGMPFGPGPRAALDAALGMAARWGVATNTGDGYLGWAEVPGQSFGHLATITHLDVVPPGDGWGADPYTLRERDGWFMGRGVLDDKGPSILCLYLAKFFAEAGLPLRYGLRVLLGCNEESHMADVPYYLAQNPQPLFCFSPDADFPVCNGEKGIFSGDFLSSPLTGNLVEFFGGVASNVVPDTATCLVKADAATLQPTPQVTMHKTADGLARLVATGIGGHASKPEGTVNAIGLLVRYLLENRLCTAGEESFLRLLHRLHGHTDGSGLSIACTDGAFGPLTCIGGMIALENGRLRQNINIRFPTATTGAQLTAQLRQAAEPYGAQFVPGLAMEPYYIPADSPAIQTLLGAYATVTGRAVQPYTMGGGTYARLFRSAVSFGPDTPDETLPPFAGQVHGANEAVRRTALLQALRVYLYAVWKLQQVDL